MSAEEWQPVPGWPYEASSLGRVRSVERVLGDGRQAGGILLAQSLDSDGYPKVTLRDGSRSWTVRVAVLVMLAHAGPCPKGREVRHRNGVRTDSRRSNLLYGTRGQNEKDKGRHRRKRLSPLVARRLRRVTYGGERGR